MKIIVRQLNGLGNQLFRYAAGLYVAKRFGGHVENLIQLDPDPAKREAGRPFLLDRFALSGVSRHAAAIDRLIQSEKPLLQPLAGALRAVTGTALFYEPEHYHFTPVPDTLRDAKQVYMRGFWQVATYAEAIADPLRQDLRFVEAPTGRNLSRHSQIRADDNAVSVHIRRTDYVTLDLPQKPMRDTYYRRAVAEIERHVAAPSFYVFSDEIAYARSLFGGDARFQFVDHNDNDTSHEDLRLMSACRHHIIANSTFSWWGAWLGDNPNKTVIAPYNWWGVAGTHFPDIYPRGWTVLDD